MSHSFLFSQLQKILNAVYYCDRQHLSTDEGLAQFTHLQQQRFITRRKLLIRAGQFTTAGTIAGWASPQLHQAIAAPKPIDAKVAIVGAGLAGLACAYELKKQGMTATVYEANNRAGGRCSSIQSVFPGQVAENGGEFIDTTHTTMLGYAREFNLAIEDVTKQPGETVYYFNTQRYTDAAVVSEFRALVDALRDDLRSLSPQPTAEHFTDRDRQLDNISLQSYLDSRGAGSLIKAVLKAAYIGEYGRELDEQSCVAFLKFIHADRRSKFHPFGVFSDERYHVVGGNQKIADSLLSQVQSQVQFGKYLTAAKKNTSGSIELLFSDRSSVVVDAVILAVPFSILREVDLTGLNLPAEKQRAIANFTYGNNAKLMVGFNARPWLAAHGNGSVYADLPHLRNVWETNAINASDRRGILTSYSGGEFASTFSSSRIQFHAERFVENLDTVFPGASSALLKNNTQIVAQLATWENNPFSKGSYTCNAPGYFTTIAGLEGKPIDNVFFAGEHTSSFYDFQGFMEGAAVSGLTAAKQVLQYLKGA